MQQKTASLCCFFKARSKKDSYLFCHCGARRARFKPGFFRSFFLASRVSNPCFFKTVRCAGSIFKSALEIPRLAALACEAIPPPLVSTITLNSFSAPIIVRGSVSILCKEAEGKYESRSRLLILISPRPSAINLTFAKAVLRRPVAKWYLDITAFSGAGFFFASLSSFLGM